MKPMLSAKPPSRKERVTFRLMILLGLISMFFFWERMLDEGTQSHSLLYGLLLVALGFSCLKILHEWYHYFIITVPKAPTSTQVYTVDIFTTFCAGEPYEMIVETLTAIQDISYPHTTYLCDEADDPYLKKVCHQLGVHHITRTEKNDAKAGNINNALKQSSGDLCVILDPDHVPFSHFLDPIVPHFNDPQIGYVQIVQAYKNHDDSLIAKGAAQQTYQFYGPMMMTMNRYGTVPAIGANCTFRRSALESIGGHAAGLAEDMHTSMQLHAKGWKSVYVPAVLARGLVPSTLSAYYKQQLKWSRGVFELLVSTYPRLFKQFTWQQKLHYGVIPLHYASGFVYLINFAIPILALLFGLSPVHIDFAHFGLIALPFISAVILIRHFAQWWVMEDQERGFHVVGGLLMIGTWWVFIVGFVYTIIQKKVPYIPTPKDNREADNWRLNIPNLVVIGLSMVACTYGLYRDWNPYNLIMANFAGLNACILGFTILASREQQFGRVVNHFPWLAELTSSLKTLKINFWLVRRRIYTAVRSTASLLTISLLSWITYISYLGENENWLPSTTNQFRLDPVLSQKLRTISRLFDQEQSTQPVPFTIAPLSITWENISKSVVPFASLDSIYQLGSIPMITWTPIVNKSDVANPQRATAIVESVLRGDYDADLRRFSQQIIALKRPICLSLVPDIDMNTASFEAKTFRDYWQYVHDYFTRQGVYNAIWVWDLGKANRLNTYFPGKSYVDWISVTNFSAGLSSKLPYRPIDQHPLFRSRIPIVFISSGTISSANNRSEGSVTALTASKSNYPAMNSYLIVHQPGPHKSEAPKSAEIPKLMLLAQPYTDSTSVKPKNFVVSPIGVSYKKGQNWTKSLQAFTQKELMADFEAMKQVGLNTIRRYGPTIYDYNILKAAQSSGLKIQYSYWIPELVNFRQDQARLTTLSQQILSSVNDLKEKETIVSWHLGNAILQKLSQQYAKPELLYQQYAYLSWLKKLVIAIKQIDPDRPVTVDVEVNETLPQTIDILHRVIPEIDSYGLLVEGQMTVDQRRIIRQIRLPYFFSSISVSSYAEFRSLKTPVFFSNWQDEQLVDQVSFNGLRDHWGRNKFSLLQLRQLRKGIPLLDSQPTVKILRPALATEPNAVLSYHVLLNTGGKWRLASDMPSTYSFEWKLVKLDPLGKPIAIQAKGNGPILTLSIPPNPSCYRLMLYVLSGSDVVNVVTSSLNTPLL
ncbi:glycosyltransferase family 2 protein [Siphonobacter sp. SORGH_AS_0500]|uniref:glycosyltransferase family 2 protein n=1 Tax=Siphonobacter sp. SORGH_AS_0500 TaxID=1864824 RepID=UPI00286284A8|nr:glycosyltransferase family 2 protein [Siphonobacter sp. SORGH_AS_0500]MDR6195355.1 cellulose synthase (UDP-forming) [Siphonobacter sp. SORGH_AS_0500]